MQEFFLVPQLLFFNLTKITRHYFHKTYKIFEKFDVVSRTFSISSLKFLLKLASHYEKVAEHVSSFPSAAGDHRLVISVYG